MGFLFALTLAVAPASVIGPTGVELERLIDTTVQLPGTTDPLIWDGPPPVPCGRGVVFRAAEVTASRSWVYYVTSSTVEVVVDENTTVAGSSVGFHGIGDIRCVEEDRYVFLGVEAPPSTRPGSVYEWTVGGQVDLILSGGVLVDGYDLGPLLQLGVNQHGLGMLGQLVPQSAGEALFVKPWDGELRFVADEQATMPGQSQPVTGYTSPRMMGSDLVFRALTLLSRGLYRWSDGEGISLLADDQTPVPGGGGTFAGVGFITVLAEGIAFGATYSGGTGIFLVDRRGQIEPLVTPGQTTVGGETILAAYEPSGAGNLMAFRGVTAETDPFESVFARAPDGRIYRLLGLRDVIEDQTVILVDAAANHQSVIVRILTNTLQGIIYRVTFDIPAIDIPTLSRFGSAALVAILLLTGLLILRSRGPI